MLRTARRTRVIMDRRTTGESENKKRRRVPGLTGKSGEQAGLRSGKSVATVMTTKEHRFVSSEQKKNTIGE